MLNTKNLLTPISHRKVGCRSLQQFSFKTLKTKNTGKITLKKNKEMLFI